MCLRESSFTALQQGDINDLLRVSFPVQINRVIIKLASTVDLTRLTTPSCPVPGVGLGGLAPSPNIPVSGGLAPPPDISVLGGLPLTQDDFRTHRAPLPSQSMTARSRRSCAPSPQAPSTAYAISARDDTPRPS